MYCINKFLFFCEAIDEASCAFTSKRSLHSEDYKTVVFSSAKVLSEILRGSFMAEVEVNSFGIGVLEGKYVVVQRK